MSSSEWSKLIDDIKRCSKCRLSKYRRNPVPGEGNPHAKIMFIGEAPGAREDATGRPFVGAAGKLLTQLIESIGLKREEVYITNVVKCRPPNNRDPEEDEISACSPYLTKQIQLIKPAIIVALGRHAAKFLFESAGLKWRNMGSMHGRVFDAVLFGVKTKLIATYHPAAALYYPKLRPELEEDFSKLKKLYSREVAVKSKPRSLLDFF